MASLIIVVWYTLRNILYLADVKRYAWRNLKRIGDVVSFAILKPEIIPAYLGTTASCSIREDVCNTGILLRKLQVNSFYDKIFWGDQLWKRKKLV